MAVDNLSDIQLDMFILHKVLEHTRRICRVLSISVKYDFSVMKVHHSLHTPVLRSGLDL